ncbi:MAG: B12-binding domain-containing protein [Ilumatobacter sp.]|uniref:B12-binding domain-containing protein n=1 Tax=Ilumatobacter sp. TaxID=1967498 RepID=UPI00260EF770|nr:B12-binding domain-containing protein [Ilumatobacter sp.]MDJ0769634.1 B12-binding domain-containing protein [Ilumatobacter sp.]
MAQTPQLDLHEAADELGVHYQTAYRWVRTGKLPAAMVNGRYVVSRADLEAVEQRRSTPRSPEAPSRRRLDHAAERMHDAMVAGDEAAARQIAGKLADEGASVRDVAQHVLVPPLRHIGQAWHDGELTIWVEHRAAAITERILGELAPNPRGRRRGTAMVAAVAGDRHSLPTSMAALALRDDNWHVHHLGADMPPAELVGFCADHDVDVAVLTVTNPSTLLAATEVAGELGEAGVPTIVGAPGRSLDELIDRARTARSRAA